MGASLSFYVRNLVAGDMRERVSQARRRGEPLAIPENADAIERDYPGSGLTADDVRNRLFAEASNAGVRVEMKRDRH